MSLPKALNIPLLSLFLLMLAHKVRSQEDFTSFDFNSFSPSSKNLTYQGDAFVPSGSSFARLTRTDSSGKPAVYSVGRVVYSPPIKLWEPGRQSVFETTIKFKITAANEIPADGITFFIIPVNSPIPNNSTGGSFGLFDLETGLAPTATFAVEFDTYFEGDNRKWDPSFRHIGIDINSRTSKMVTRFETPFGKVVIARITYYPTVRTIIVSASYGSQTSSLSYVVDLKTILPQQVQVGISGATGGLIALHDLLSWHFISRVVRESDNVEDHMSKKQDNYLKQYV